MENPSDTSPATPHIASVDLTARQALYQNAFALLSRPLADLSPAEGALLLEELRPRPEDYARVFVSEYAEQAQTFYTGLYLAPRLIERGPHQTVLRLFMASAAELRDKTPHALGFPGGYTNILEFLQPDSIWVHWKYVAPHSSTGIAYDGLTRIDDRWVWLPKPYRFLSKAAAAANPTASEEPPPAPEPAPEPAAKSRDDESPQAVNIWKE